MDSIDKQILDFLDQKPSHPSELARKSALSRTTIQYRLARLADLGYVQKSIVGKKSIWKSLYHKEKGKGYFKIYRDREIISAYAELLNLPRHSTILAIQGRQAAKMQFKHLPGSFLEQAHQVFKKKGIIIKGAMNREALRSFETLDETIMKSHVGRTLGVKVLDNNLFLGSGEIMSSKNILLLSNPATERATVIKDRGITEIVYETLSLIFESLGHIRSFDLNDYLKKIHQ